MRAENIGQADPRLLWIKSSYSSEEGGECVQVASGLRTVFVRDSKETSRPGLAVATGAWAAFVGFAVEQPR
ncbi:DUF397 domain-containing protein [Streptomyces sp. YIM S03343]